jgi:hypothetical protein
MNPLTPDSSKPSHLRERRGVDLHVTIPFEFSDTDDQLTERLNPTTAINPSEIPKNGKGKEPLPSGVYDLDDDADADILESTEAIALQDGLRGLQRLVPGLFVAFNADEGEDDDDDDGGVDTIREPRFTHIISLSTRARTAESTTSTTAVYHSVDPNGVHRLRLIVPHPAYCCNYSAPGTRFRLSKSQLLSARDFLSLALPYYVQYRQPISTRRPAGTDVCVLVTASFACPAEAIAVAACYLSFMSQRSVRQVLDYIDDDDEILGVWKNTVVCKRVVGVVEDVAGMAA